MKLIDNHDTTDARTSPSDLQISASESF